MIKTWAMAACVAVAGLVVAVNAAAQNGFAPHLQAQYQSECTAGGASAELCACVWNGVQQRMSGEEFQALDTAMRSQQLHPSMAKYELIVGVCNGTSRVTASNPEAYPGHTSTNFMNGCQQGGVSQAICACSMNQFERTMSLQEFTELDRMMSWGKGEEHPLYQSFISTVQTCARNNPG